MPKSRPQSQKARYYGPTPSRRRFCATSGPGTTRMPAFPRRALQGPAPTSLATRSTRCPTTKTCSRIENGGLKRGRFARWPPVRGSARAETPPAALPACHVGSALSQNRAPAATRWPKNVEKRRNFTLDAWFPSGSMRTEVNARENQFSPTRAASKTDGAVKSKFLSGSISPRCRY
jgi:hypothetical protein